MTTSNSQQKNFIASLFDFGFTSFVTLRFLKVIYAIMTVIILLVGLFALIGGLRTGNSSTIILTIIFAPLGTLVYLVLTRITFELIAMFFRIGDNTYVAVQLLSGGRAGQWDQGAQPGYGPPAPYGSQAVPSAPWGYGQGQGDSAGSAPAGSPYSASQPTYGQPQANYGQPQPNYGHPQAEYGQPPSQYGQPSAGAGGQHVQPPETPQSRPGNEK
jgi:hypothetical protein